LRTARGSAIENAKKKLIRFPGHFKRYVGGRHDHCTAYYFDGRLCQAELVDMIDEYVRNWMRGKVVAQIFYHATISSWLERAAIAFGERRNIAVENLETALSDGKTVFPNDILVILPLVDTGATIERLAKEIRERNSDAQIGFVTILKAVDLQSPTQITNRSGSISFDSLIEVEQTRFDVGHCKMCNANVPVNDSRDPDPYLKLSTQAFWSLALNMNFADERDVPPYRESIGYLPQFKNIAKADGPFLAYKITKMLRSLGNRLPATPIIVCPSEDGVSAVAGWLEQTFGMTVIRIPKGAFTNSEQLEPTTRSYQASDPVSDRDQEIWFGQLRSATQVQREFGDRTPILTPPAVSAIILDEINVSGQTRDNLVTLAQKFGLEILCCMSVVNLAAVVRVENWPQYSLYDVDLVS
jgi:hypothetical protein